MQTMNGFVPLFSAAADAIKNNNGNGNGKTTQQQTQQQQQQQAGKFNNRRKRPFPQVSSRKLVPFTEVEWKYVQRKFMSEDPANLKQICDIMNMWINRMGNDTPVFVNISDLVLRALALEGKQPSVAAAGRASSSTSSRQEDRCSFAQQSHHQLDNADLGLIYGSVIIRFVNYVNEICQPERAPLVPIATAVSKMQIPTWVVNLRHQATHAQMPSMNLMKEAIKFCRTWLWQKHWSKPLTDAIKQTLPEIYEQQQEQQKNTLDNRIVNALRRFREWRRRFPTYTEFSWPTYAQQPSKSKRGGGSGQKNFHDQLRETIQALLDSNPEEFISMFSLTCLSHGTSDSEQEIFAHDPNGPAGHLLRGTLFSRENHIDTISGHEQQCYAPIFELMNAKGLLPSALLGITRLIASAHPSFAQRCHLAGWANKMLAAYLETPTKISTQNWRSILRHFVMAAQFFREENIKSLIEFLNENESINEKWRKKLETLLKIRHIGNSELENQQRGSNNKQNNEHLSISTMSASSQQSVKTLADLQSKLRHEDEAENTFLRDPLTMESDWSLANADELGTVLGLTADQKADTLCLALDCDFYTA